MVRDICEIYDSCDKCYIFLIYEMFEISMQCTNRVTFIL